MTLMPCLDLIMSWRRRQFTWVYILFLAVVPCFLQFVSGTIGGPNLHSFASWSACRVSMRASFTPVPLTMKSQGKSEILRTKQYVPRHAYSDEIHRIPILQLKKKWDSHARNKNKVRAPAEQNAHICKIFAQLKTLINHLSQQRPHNADFWRQGKKLDVIYHWICGKWRILACVVMLLKVTAAPSNKRPLQQHHPDEASAVRVGVQTALGVASRRVLWSIKHAHQFGNDASQKPASLDCKQNKQSPQYHAPRWIFRARCFRQLRNRRKMLGREQQKLPAHDWRPKK